MRSRSRQPTHAATVVFALMLLVGAGAALAQPTPTLVSRFDAGGFDLGEGVAVGHDGRIAVTGFTEINGDQDIVTALFNPDGTLAWSRAVDEGPRDRGGGVALDRAGNVFVAGTIRASGDDVVLVKYGPTGDHEWSVRFDKGTSETSRSVALDPFGNIIVAGASLSVNGGDGFVAKFSSNGEELWSRPVNIYWLDEFFAVATDDGGNIIAAGRVADRGNFNLIVRKFTPTGATAWTQYIGGDGNQEGRGVAVDGDGNVYVSGTAAKLAGEEVSTDVLVAKFSPSGSLLWRRDVDIGGGADEGRGAATDAGGNVLVTGFGRINGNKDPFVLKLDPDGEVIWRQATPGSGIDGTGSIAVTSDGALVAVAGATQRSGADFDYLLIGLMQGRPGAFFTVVTQQPIAGAPVAFEDSSAPDQVPIVTRLWDFGDGSTSSELNPVHTYASGGSYSVRLSVRDAWGNVGHHAREVRVAATTSGAVVGDDAQTRDVTPTGPTVGDEPAESTGTPAPGTALVLATLAGLALLARGRRSR